MLFDIPVETLDIPVAEVLFDNSQFYFTNTGHIYFNSFNVWIYQLKDDLSVKPPIGAGADVIMTSQ